MCVASVGVVLEAEALKFSLWLAKLGESTTERDWTPFRASVWPWEAWLDENKSCRAPAWVWEQQCCPASALLLLLAEM